MTRFLTSALALLFITTTALANNRTQTDEIFQPKSDDTLAIQAILGIGEYLALNYIHANREGLAPFNTVRQNQAQEVIQAAQEKLTRTDLSSLEREQLTKLIGEQEAHIKKLNQAAINSAVRATGYGRYVKSVSVVAQGLMIVDLFGRVYVWSTLDRDPGISPIGIYFWKKVSQ